MTASRLFWRSAGTLVVLVWSSATAIAANPITRIRSIEDLQWLIELAQKIELPKTVPACASRGEIPEEYELAKEALDEARARRDGSIVSWEFTCRTAPDYYRVMKRLWRSGSRGIRERLKFLSIAQEFILETTKGTRELLVPLTLDVMEDVLGSHSGSKEDRVRIQEFLLKLLGELEDKDWHDQILNGPMKELLPLSETMTRAVLMLATGPHAEIASLRKIDNELLSRTASLRAVDESVLRYLLDCVQGGVCDVCRAWCVSEDHIERYGRERILAVYLDTLRIVSRDPNLRVLAQALVRAVGLGGKYEDATPCLIGLLNGDDVKLKVMAITSLERIHGLGKEDLHYVGVGDIWRRGLFDELRSSEVEAAVEVVSSKWKLWWRQNSRSLERSKETSLLRKRSESRVGSLVILSAGREVGT